MVVVYKHLAQGRWADTAPPLLTQDHQVKLWSINPVGALQVSIGPTIPRPFNSQYMIPVGLSVSPMRYCVARQAHGLSPVLPGWASAEFTPLLVRATLSAGAAVHGPLLKVSHGRTVPQNLYYTFTSLAGHPIRLSLRKLLPGYRRSRAGLSEATCRRCRTSSGPRSSLPRSRVPPPCHRPGDVSGCA